NIVLDDADLEHAARWNIQRCFFNPGQSCHAPSQTSREFYDLKPTKDNPAGVDQPEGNLLKDCPSGQDPVTCLPKDLQDTYQKLADELDTTLESGKPASKCQKKGDGNLDQRVNQADIDGWEAYNG